MIAARLVISITVITFVRLAIIRIMLNRFDEGLVMTPHFTDGLSPRIYFRADAASAMPAVYESLEAEQIKYATRLPASQILQHRIGYLLKHPVGRPLNEGSMPISPIKRGTGRSRAG